MESEVRSLKNKLRKENARRESSEGQSVLVNTRDDNKSLDIEDPVNISGDAKDDNDSMDKSKVVCKVSKAMSLSDKEGSRDSDEMVVIREAETSSTLFINNNSSSPTP